MIFDAFQYAREIGKYLFVSESERFKAKVAQIDIAKLIFLDLVRQIVVASVHLDDQAVLRAVKVEDERFPGVLTAESQLRQRLSSQRIPEYFSAGVEFFR